MAKKIKNSTGINLPKIFEAALAGNRQRIELLTLNAIRSLREDSPEIADQLSDLLSQYSTSGGAFRGVVAEPIPADADVGLSLLRINDVSDASPPILPQKISSEIAGFLKQRAEVARLAKEGFLPPRTLLLKGAPGTGKTMLARWIARELRLPLVVLDLATAMSSFLGKTGANLRRSLDYARSVPCVILLDEFDAIGKRRDDVTEVGELKRIVNVLLKELEEWPLQSVLVAATNHPELLDPAINRRFDVMLELPLPDQTQRTLILREAAGRFAETLPVGYVDSLASVLEGANGSEINTLVQRVVREHIVEHSSLPRAFIAAMLSRMAEPTPEKIGVLARTLKETANLSVREIGEVLGKGSSTIQYHLQKPQRKEKEEHHV